MDKVYCFFSARYLPCLGGVERYTYNLAKELTQKGNKVIIVTSLIGNELEYEERDEAIVYRLPSINLMGGRFPITIIGKKYKSIKNALKHANIDYIIVNTRFYFLSYLGAAFSKKNEIPAIVIEHGTGHFTVNNSIIDFFGRIYEHFISNLVKRNADNFYGVSEACVDWLQHFGINGKGTLFNAIDINMIGALHNKSNIALEKRVSYSSDDYIITYTGRLIKEKGILKLIEAFRKVKSKYPQVKLCIAGDGDLYDSITDEEGIYKLGRLSFEDVIGLLQLSKIYCLPTDYPEGLPTSVLEAIACKCYVITSEMGGAKEVISDASYGVILKENSIDGIEEAIVKAIDNPQMCEKAVIKAYDKVCSNYTWSKTADTLMNVFEGI